MADVCFWDPPKEPKMKDYEHEAIWPSTGKRYKTHDWKQYSIDWKKYVTDFPWRGKVIKGKNPRAEIRTYSSGAQILITVYKTGKITFGQNATSVWTPEKLQDIPIVVQEAIEKLNAT